MESEREKSILVKCCAGDYVAFNHIVSYYNNRAYYPIPATKIIKVKK